MNLQLSKAINLFLALELDYPAYLVGGSLRDLYLDRESGDLDIVVERKGGAQKYSAALKKSFADALARPCQVGKTSPVWKTRFLKDPVWNGKRYALTGVEIDVSETQDEKGAFASLTTDLQRRDFTINMLAKNLKTGELIDLAGGIEDLKNRRLRCHPGQDPVKIFEADPLRLLRMSRFIAMFNFQAQASLLEAAKKKAALLDQVSQERIRDEIRKAAEAGKLAQFIRECDKSASLEIFLPEVARLKGVEQDVYHHSEGDVFIHTLLTVEKAKPRLLDQMGALLHDIAKPMVQERVPMAEGAPDRIRFIGHENLGADLAKEICSRLKFDNKFISRISKMVRMHLRANTSQNWSEKAVRKFIRDAGEELDPILDLTEADVLSARGPAGETKENPIPRLRSRIKETQKIPTRPRPLLSGEEIMKRFDLKPGPLVGEMLERLIDFEDELAQKKEAPDKELELDFLSRTFFN